MRVSGRGLAFGADTEEAAFLPLGQAQATVRRRGARLEVNGAPVVGDAVRFRAGAGAPRRRRAPATSRSRPATCEVRGDVVVRLYKDGLQLINVIPLEDYLAAVLGSEMPVSFPLEALKAQAVAARTYALQKKLEAYGSAFHMGSSVLHQVYGGVDREDPRTRAAVEATRGEVLTYELAPIEAYFHASCGGRTESGQDALQRDLPYLQPVDCPCGSCPRAAGAPRSPRGAARRALRHSAEGLRVTARTATGRVSRVATAGGAALDAAQLRQRLGYTRSRAWTSRWSARRSGYRFTGRGYGHGAGLCQWGAKVLADEGRAYREILSPLLPGRRAAAALLSQRRRASRWRARGWYKRHRRVVPPLRLRLRAARGADRPGPPRRRATPRAC